MTQTRIAINGFGRIGRATARIIQNHPDLQLVAINDLSPISTAAYLFEFDSNFGTFAGDISADEKNSTLKINKSIVEYSSQRNIEDLPWKKLNVDVVLECTGVFRSKEDCQRHIDSGARKVILSAPPKGDGFQTIVLGVNDEHISADKNFYSNASCTTNCLAPVVKTLHDAFGITSGLMTTVHSYTNDQRVLDIAHSDPRRSRAAAVNIIPTSTGAACAIGLVMPELNGKLNGISIRVPTPTVSLVDFTAQMSKEVSAEDINAALTKAAAKNPHILGVESRPLVSKDYQGDTRSSIVDLEQTMVSGHQVKVVSWYDNEWGYSNRLVELAGKIA